MSVRFFKILSGVLIAHLVILSVVWVGFSVPNPRPPATFTYEGTLPAEESSSTVKDAWQVEKGSDQFSFDHFEASYFNHWIKIRNPSKTFTYDHLGF